MVKKSSDGSAVTVSKILHKVTPEQQEAESKNTALTTIIGTVGARIVNLRTRLALSNTSQVLLNDLDEILGIILSARELVEKQIELDKNPPAPPKSEGEETNA